MKQETTKSEAWNPKYVAYAAEAGRTPEEQLAHDKAHYPGGCMAGFIVWVSSRQMAGSR